MAAKKSEGAKVPTIVGTVRHKGKLYQPGDEKDLAAALKEDGVESVRGFGVDSTDRGTRVIGRTDTKRAQIAARAEQARREANGETSGEEGGESVDLTETTLAELPGALAKISDKKALQAARRKDHRAGAKPLYAARLEEINAAVEGAGESGETDAPDDGTEE